MEKISQRLNRFFFPPADASRWVRIMPYALLGVLTLMLLTAAAYGW